MKPLFHPLLHLAQAAVLLVLLIACGGGEGPELGDFPAITKSVNDPPFTITAPSSRSPAPFTFTSSNPAVATIDGAQVTIRGLGQSTITAAQNGLGTWGPTHKSTTLTVDVACPTGQVRVNGVCTVPPTCEAPATLVNGVCTVQTKCVAPATLVDNQCKAPTITAAFVTNAPLTWRGISHTDKWTNARDFCEDSVINNTTGWRLPTADELSALYNAGVLANRGWALSNTWSTSVGSSTQTPSHVVINLSTGERGERADTAVSYVGCVR
jgi:hypothetical protein